MRSDLGQQENQADQRAGACSSAKLKTYFTQTRNYIGTEQQTRGGTGKNYGARQARDEILENCKKRKENGSACSMAESQTQQDSDPRSAFFCLCGFGNYGHIICLKYQLLLSTGPPFRVLPVEGVPPTLISRLAM